MAQGFAQPDSKQAQMNFIKNNFEWYKAKIISSTSSNYERNVTKNT